MKFIRYIKCLISRGIITPPKEWLATVMMINLQKHRCVCIYPEASKISRSTFSDSRDKYSFIISFIRGGTTTTSNGETESSCCPFYYNLHPLFLFHHRSRLWHWKEMWGVRTNYIEEKCLLVTLLCFVGVQRDYYSTLHIYLLLLPSNLWQYRIWLEHLYI